MVREDFYYMECLLENLVQAVTYMEAVPFEEFIRNDEKQQAVARRIETGFEAAFHLSHEFKELFPEIRWDSIEDLRKELEQKRFELDDALIWDLATHDAVYLIFQIRDVMEMLYSEE